MRSGDQRPRAFDEYTKKQSSSSEADKKQMRSVKKQLQNLETLVSEDVFGMLDNLSACVAQKDNEVQ
jgi:hypothetical protein